MSGDGPPGSRRPARGPRPPDPEPPDTGAPIAELAGLGHPASRTFLDRVRRRLQRRMIGGHIASLAWHGVAVVLLEFLRLIFGLLGRPDRTRGDSR